MVIMDCLTNSLAKVFKYCSGELNEKLLLKINPVKSKIIDQPE